MFTYKVHPNKILPLGMVILRNEIHIDIALSKETIFNYTQLRAVLQRRKNGMNNDDSYHINHHNYDNQISKIFDMLNRNKTPT